MAISQKSSRKEYSTIEVAKLVDLTPRRIRQLVQMKIIKPVRSSEGESLFDFQSLVQLRSAKDLIEAGISLKRLKRSLKRLQSRLGSEISLSSIRLTAEGRKIIAQEGGDRWNSETDQLLFNFGAFTTDISSVELKPFDLESSGQKASLAAYWFEHGCRLEIEDLSRAVGAYQKVLELQPDHPHALLNLGRLHHVQGHLKAAEAIYFKAQEACPENAIVYYNLAVLFEDLNRLEDAVSAYRKALDIEPEFAEAYYNLAMLLEKVGRSKEAVQHLKEYRRLQKKGKL